MTSQHNSDSLEAYAKTHPNENLECTVKHSSAIDRACDNCGYGIWTNNTTCPHCGEPQECHECNPDEFDEERSQPFW